ncbi:MAG: membrane protein insertase YidC [Gammaproteobacteria bacterium]|nr:membrane protein insertase YidC [Gammaproteobacteria bacterium]
MEQQRLILFIALSLVLFLIWDAWQREINPQPVNQPVEVTSSQGTSGIPVSAQDKNSEVPMSEAPASSRSMLPISEDKALVKQAQRIKIRTDVFDAEIDTTGGDLRVANLLKYPKQVTEPDVPFQLMKDNDAGLFIAQSGFTLRKSQGEILNAAPNHTTIYSTDKTHYEMAEGENELKVNLIWQSPEGVEFIKTYTFARGKYLINVGHTINNRSKNDWSGNLYQQLQRTTVPDSEKSNFIHTYTGGVIYSPEKKYEKIDFDDIAEKNLSRQVSAGWAAMIQHYFLAAWIPAAEIEQEYYSLYKANPDRYSLGMKSVKGTNVTAGTQQTINNRLYVGPKSQNKLEAITPGLELTVDYGILTILSKPLFWLLDHIHSLVNNWGWAVILLTLFIKLAFYKLSETSYKSMAHMRKMAPRIQQLKERYGDDRQKMGQAQMELFRKEKINPLGGCLPILVQIPVFIALYWVLLESVELRQAPWALWIKDMSTADPYFILPLLMGISMFIQQKLNPAPIDPIQAKVMMALPFVFTIFFAFFPAGLVLYWVVNNLLSITQQWYITRKVIKE